MFADPVQPVVLHTRAPKPYKLDLGLLFRPGFLTCIKGITLASPYYRTADRSLGRLAGQHPNFQGDGEAQMYNTIIVPIDLSHTDRAQDIVDSAKELGNDGCAYICVFVEAEMPGYLSAGFTDEFRRETQNKSRETLEAFVEKSGLDATLDIRTGQAASGILDAAEEAKADLIIIGPHRPGMEGFLLGSTAARVVRYANCDVLVKR